MRMEVRLTARAAFDLTGFRGILAFKLANPACA